jgi:hypothetical protein
MLLRSVGGFNVCREERRNSRLQQLSSPDHDQSQDLVPVFSMRNMNTKIGYRKKKLQDIWPGRLWKLN